jgi:hypothetical protein
MAEQNGVIKLDRPIDSLEGWEIVDAAGGRRYIGLVEDEKVDAHGVHWVTLSKCVEMNPVNSNAILVPMGGGPMGGGVDIKFFTSDAGSFMPPMSIPCLPRWTVQKVGGALVKDMPGIWRDGLLKALQGLEARQKGMVKDAERGKAAEARREEGSREKVR